MLKKITLVKLHSPDTHLPSVGSIGDTLPHPSKTYKKLEMYFDSQNLFLTINDVKAIIPSANIKIMICAEDHESPRLKAVNAN